jgi:predicted XRE-type DNA-binding protein
MKDKTFEEELADTRASLESGSVYQQLGMKSHKDMETKADLVIEIEKTIKKKRLTQTDAADILGISQPKLSELLNGRFRGYSVERLIHFLNELGKDVDIVIRPKRGNQRGSLRVKPAYC